VLCGRGTPAGRAAIPVFHDDPAWHRDHRRGGAPETDSDIQGKSLAHVRVVISALALRGSRARRWRARWCDAGPYRVVDSVASCHAHRQDLNPYKRRFATTASGQTLADVLRGADVFVGERIVDADMLSRWRASLVFALANPEPKSDLSWYARSGGTRSLRVGAPIPESGQ